MEAGTFDVAAKRLECVFLKKRYLQALAMLNKELGVVRSLSSTLSSFKEDPSIAAGGVGRARAFGGRDDAASAHVRDPDVWPPPTPQEPRY